MHAFSSNFRLIISTSFNKIFIHQFDRKMKNLANNLNVQIWKNFQPRIWLSKLLNVKSNSIEMYQLEKCYIYNIFTIFSPVAEPHTKLGGQGPPQNLKKLIYSMYIICILKNVACKNWSWPPQILSYFNGALKRKRNYIKII